MSGGRNLVIFPTILAIKKHTLLAPAITRWISVFIFFIALWRWTNRLAITRSRFIQIDDNYVFPYFPNATPRNKYILIFTKNSVLAIGRNNAFYLARFTRKNNIGNSTHTFSVHSIYNFFTAQFAKGKFIITLIHNHTRYICASYYTRYIKIKFFRIILLVYCQNTLTLYGGIYG